MIKKFILMGLFLFVSSHVKADELKNNFVANLTQVPLDSLTKDLGAVMGGGSFHQGKSLGFPLGVDFGVHVPVVKLKKENVILTDDESALFGAFGQLEYGLPGRINLIARTGKIYDGTLLGGGLRFGIIKSAIPGLPSLSVSGLYNQLSHDYIDVKSYSGNVVLSFDVPFVHPYIGAGYDKTSLEPTAQAFQSAPASVSRSLKGESEGYRAEVGVNLSFIPFTYLSLGAGLANAETMYHLGLGVKF
ncbi:MAG: hypothetical protein ACKVQC_02650 [Elusimicrobiota bacterium]